jgi:subtilisin family serine protease
MKKLIFTVILAVFVFASASAQIAEVSGRLKAKLSTMSQLEYTPIIVLLKDRVDIEALDAQLYSIKANAQLRSKTVIDALMDKARNTQGPILAMLENKKLSGKVRNYESFWITNMLVIDANAETIRELILRTDIETVDLDALLDYDRPVGPPIDAPDGTEASEIGLKVIKANMLWEAGITGQGRLVMNIDTGVDVNHPALNYKWRGNNGVPWYHAWMDKNGSTTQPTDCDVHGTHTMGIMCGRSPSGDTVGVAPNAQWIAARTICSSPHTSNSIAAFQWAMNPDSNSNTTNDMPDAIGNSWHDPGLSNECTSIYVSTLNSLEAAGIAVVFSCGNAGPGVSTITKPKNVNTNLVNTFSVGNINGNSPFPYPISSSSSRGPSLCGGSGSLLIKPEVCAPGTSVRSSVPGGGYSLLSGTSMACPHIVGAVALLKQVAPNLTGKQILEALYNTAVQLPVNGVENNDYGKGVIDVWAAYQSLGPVITHTPLPNTENLTGPYPVNVSIASTLSGVATVKLFWSRNNPVFTDSVLMVKGTGNNWSYNIPGNGTTATYRYYIKAIDSTGRSSTNPAGAPATYHTFLASLDTQKPVITHTAITDVPKVQWPVTVSANVTDNIGIDSSWVKWYKNTPAVIKQFKLLNTSGSTYAAPFNSVNADVNPGDSIFYRIFARDNSSAHNTDSTALYKFKIINLVDICVGTGTVATGWPYYTFYMDSRTQMLYTAAEIIAAGGGPGMITQVGFNVITASSQVMNGFKVRMQNTAVGSISSFLSTGWTTVYDGTYTVPGTGLQYVTLTTPFGWNGTSNVLVEICFNNSSYTSNTTVNGTAATGRVAHNHSDLSSGDGCTGITSPGTTYTTLPNICFKLTPVTGAGNNLSEVPKVYSLAQNYPNPFNPVTKINFAIPKQGFVTLKVYDVLGREVSTLVNEVKQTGNYSVDFDASYLSSGVYFYRIESGGFSDIKRMILIK